jgi:hypothetical protein
MAFFNEQWFIHKVSDTVIHLAQQKQSKVRGAITTREGVVGKTDPWQRVGPQDMVPSTSRDADTTYLNPPQSKRRAVLVDRNAAVLIDDFDKVRMLANPQSEFAQMLAYARERELDKLTIAIPGLAAAGAAQAGVGGILGLATVVDEAAETNTQTALPAAQQIVNGGTTLTMAKILDAKQLMDDADVDDDERYFFYSPRAMRKLLTDTVVTSADYGTIQALSRGGFPMDATWVGFKWRQSTKLPKSGNIRSCIAVQRMAAGLSIGMITQLEVDKATHKWNNVQVVCKLTAGAVRADDNGVVQVDIDESV